MKLSITFYIVKFYFLNNLDPIYFSLSTLAFGLYFSFNTCIPIMIIIKMIRIRRKIFVIGKLDGQDYSKTSSIQLTVIQNLDVTSNSVMTSLNN